MRRWHMVLLLGLCVWATSAWAGRAARFDFGAGSSTVGAPEDGLETPRGFTGITGVSAPLGAGLRAGAEMQWMRYTAGFAGVTVPEIRFMGSDPTGVSTFMLGMEWQPPLQSTWAPFVHASMGAARVSSGDRRWSDMNTGAFVTPGDTRTLPAWSAGLGVRGHVLGVGPGLFADARYTWTDQNDRERLRLTQVFAGVSF